MSTKKIISPILIIALAIIIFGANILPISAAKKPAPANSSVPQSNNDQNQSLRLEKIKQQSAKQIENRLKTLNLLLTRIQSMKKVSDSQKTALNTLIQTNIANLNDLKTKITSCTDIATALEYEKSILKEYRIYELVAPQVYLMASIDRINTSAQTLTSLSSKLQDVINQAQTAGKNVAELQTKLAEMNSKISSAKAKAQSALDGISGLTPDQDDKDKAKANQTALKTAQTAVKAATQDIKDARDIAKTIVKSLKNLDIKINKSDSRTNPETK